MEGVSRSTQRGSTLFEKVAVLLGLAIFVLVLLAGIVALIFYATGRVDEIGLRWWATILTIIYLPSILITWRIAKREAKEHLKGFARGLDGAQLTLTSLGRGLSATASIARTSARPAARSLPSAEDLLPRVGTMRLTEANEHLDDVIDL
jgi:flagellar biosynthesis protein FliQ